MLLVIFTASAYWPVRNHQFVEYDDHLYVSENYLVQQGLTWEGVRWAFTTGHAANWHPLTWLSHMTDCQLLRTGWIQSQGNTHIANARVGRNFFGEHSFCLITISVTV